MIDKKRSTNFGINIGTSSLLLVFVILCLVSFATLSIVSANADKKLSGKVTERSSSYYDACNQANLKLKDLDESLKAVYESGVSREEFYGKVGNSFSFCVQVSDIQVLSVSADIEYPKNNGDPFYSISSWALINTGSLELDESLHLIDFED